jgi:membrane protein YqaA with SNARE-associated domain
LTNIHALCLVEEFTELLKNEARLYRPILGLRLFFYLAFLLLFSKDGYLTIMEMWLEELLVMLALPKFGLSTVFVVSLISATLLPLGSEPVVFGLIKLNPALFWPTIFVATAGNTIGGAIDWWMGYGAHRAIDKYKGSSSHAKALQWLERLGPKACLLAWLPVVGDPLCAVAGWLKLPFWPCLLYMAIGKFFRYLFLTVLLLYVFPGKIPMWPF